MTYAKDSNHNRRHATEDGRITCYCGTTFDDVDQHDDHVRAMSADCSPGVDIRPEVERLIFG